LTWIAPAHSESCATWRIAAGSRASVGPCYIAGWSACEQWGLTEQIFRDLVVVSAKPIGFRHDEIQGTPVRIKVADSKRMFGTVGVWRGSERVEVSDPSRTIVDLLDDPSMGGGIRHVAEVVEEYLAGPHRDVELLLDYCERFGNRSVYKRLGYLLEALGLDEPALIERCRDRMSSGVVLLDPGIGVSGTRNSDWNLRVNARIDRVAARSPERCSMSVCASGGSATTSFSRPRRGNPRGAGRSSRFGAPSESQALHTRFARKRSSRHRSA